MFFTPRTTYRNVYRTNKASGQEKGYSVSAGRYFDSKLKSTARQIISFS
ncbi:hypothetical protein JN06_00414 [Bacteroides zoogleoformans]|nr:hypothetical protein JN06_00414 [Bacteroides zoogleoformans]